MLPTMHPITVLIADAHIPFRQRLHRFLAQQAGIQVVGQAANTRLLLRGVEAHHPDILLLGMPLSQMAGLEDIAHIRTRSPTTKILILADSFEEEGVVRGLQQGAQGLLLKTAPPQELMKAVRTTHSGELWVPRRLLTRLVDNFRQRLDEQETPLSAMRETLTEREQEVAIWAMQGMTNNEIAVQLGISPKTVKTHLQNVFRKLNVRRRSQLLPNSLPALVDPPLPSRRSQPDSGT